MKNARRILYCFLAVVITATMFSSCKNGEDGKDGASNSVVTIGPDCTWVIDGVDTRIDACGTQGEQGEQGEQGGKGEDGEQGTPGSVVYIGNNGNWWIDGNDTDIPATGPKGPVGPGAGSVITIGADGNWYIDDNDTGVSALGSQVTIGANGNWYINGKDTQRSATGGGTFTVSEIPKTGWKAVKLPTDIGPMWESLDLENMWNGVITEFAGFYSEPGIPLPVWFTFDLGANYVLNKFKLWPRCDPNSNDDEWKGGQPKKFEVYGSLYPNFDGSWDESWTLLGQFEWQTPGGKVFNSESDITPDDIAIVRQGMEFEFEAPTVPVKYLRFNFISNFKFKSDPEYEQSPITIGEISIWESSKIETATISSLNKSKGIFGDEIIITGTGFSSTATDNEVFFKSASNSTAVKAEIIETTPTALKVVAPYFYQTNVEIYVVTNSMQSNNAKFTYDLFTCDSLAIVRDGTWTSEQLRADVLWRKGEFYAFDQLSKKRTVHVIEVESGAGGIDTHLGVAVKSDGGLQATSGLGASIDALAAINGSYFINGDAILEGCYGTAQYSLDHIRIDNEVAVMGRAPTAVCNELPTFVDACMAFSNMPDKTCDMAFIRLNATDNRNTVQSYNFGAGINPVRAAGGYEYAMAAGPWLVSDGLHRNNPNTDAHYSSERPRTAVGKNKTTGKVFLVTVDGDDAPSSGITINQFAVIMRSLGSTDAMNLDGGGSTTLWIQGKGKVSYVTNGTSYERPVANIIYVK